MDACGQKGTKDQEINRFKLHTLLCSVSSVLAFLPSFPQSALIDQVNRALQGGRCLSFVSLSIKIGFTVTLHPSSPPFPPPPPRLPLFHPSSLPPFHPPLHTFTASGFCPLL